jgi:hypothetical protein
MTRPPRPPRSAASPAAGAPRAGGRRQALGRIALPALLLALLAAGLPGCDSSNPVAPPADPTPTPTPGPGTGGTSYNVVVSSDPAQVEAGATDPAVVTIQATAATDGSPAANGTTVTINTDLGTLATTSTGDPDTLVQATLAGGSATVYFFPGDDTGTANLLAQVGNSVGRLRLSVLEQVPESFFISSVSPNVGDPAGGDLITLQGDGFVAPLLVAFASAQAQVVSVTSAQSIVVESPPSVTPVNAGSTLLVDVTVTKDLSAAEPSSTTLAGAFTYSVTELPPVFLLALSPTSGSADGGTAVTVSGGGFLYPLRVELGGAVADIGTVTDSTITLTTPASSTAVADGASLAVDVTLYNALDFGTQDPVTLAKGFTYLGDSLPPGSSLTVTSASPTTGSYQGGTTVTVAGSGFVDPVAVELGGVRQSGETVVDSGTVTFTTAALAVSECPASGVVAASGLTVTNLGTGAAGALSGFVFNYSVPIPRIDRISPTAGPQSGGIGVVVDGVGFDDPVRVLFVAGDEQYVAGLSTVTSTRISAVLPTVPVTIFPEADCQIDVDTAGKRYLDQSVDVTVINLATGCTDTFPNGFTYRPSDRSCRPVS